MKTLIKILLGALGNLLLYSSTLAQVGLGTLMGIVRDDANGDPIPFANVTVKQDGQVIAGSTTDLDGKYKVSALKPCELSVMVSVVGYTAKEISGVAVKADQIIFVDFRLSAGVKLDEVVIIEYSIPLIERDGSSATTITSHEIHRMPSRGVAAAVTTVAGVKINNGRTGSIRGSRDGSSTTYIDGVSVRGSSTLPQAAYEQVPVLSQGIPAQYENVTSGTPMPAKTKSLIVNGSSLALFAPATNESGTDIFKRDRKKLQPEGLEAGYDLYKRQAFKSVFSEPLSTFSIDVDAASYSQIRRSLNLGSLPDVDIVRIEEIVNYFKYDYPQPTGPQPFSITTEVADCPWNAAHRLVHIGLQGRELSMDGRPENNLVFLIDVSGSMSDGDKLPLLKRSLRMLVDKLNEQDHISIVVYAGAAGLVLPSTTGDKKDRILSAVDRLSAGGSTAGGAGIQLAYSIAEKEFIKKGNNRVILCTDGDFNVGISSASDLEKLIETKRETGIFLTVLGFGTGNFQDHKMETLADKGNGNFAYIDNLQEAQKVLVQEFWGTMFTIAKDVKIQVEFNPANVLAYRLIGYENRRLAAEDFNDDRKDAGELGAGHTVTALYEVIPIGADPHSEIPKVDSLKYQRTTPTLRIGLEDELLTVKLRFKEPDGTKSKLLSHVLTNTLVALDSSSENMRFSAALAQFGMTLLDKELKPSQRMEQLKRVIEMAQNSKGKDQDGRRAEFIRLAELAMVAE